MRIWLIRILGGFACILAIVALLAFDFVRSFQYSVPRYDGELSVDGIGATVRIARDQYAVPHILAESFPDAAFGLGYAHAQDRLWQMEMSRRYLQGRLAELFGNLAFDSDVRIRQLGVYAASEASVEHLRPETRAVLESYAAGVNAFLATHDGPLPLEFTLAGETPEPWRPADSVAVIKGMAMSLSGNAGDEMERISLMALLGKQSVEDFLPPFQEGPLPGYLDSLFGTTQFGSAYGIPDITASNNWAVGGAHSTTGKPLVANDPHLGFTIPSTWYLAHLALPGEDLVGGTLAGVPAIVVGRNRNVAWGLTNTGPDTQDLYVERLAPDADDLYQVPEGWAEFTERLETIMVRFGGEETVRVRATRHGPVMEGGRYDEITPEGYVMALAWPALDADDTSLDALLTINHARSAADMQMAAGFYIAPMQNLVYADESGAAGHIGLILPGRVPIRSEANDSLGLVPAPGWDARYDWQGYIPTDALPNFSDPASGRFVTANNKTVPDDYPFVLTRDWDSAYRHDRADSLLASTSRHDADGFERIQLDIMDTYAVDLKRRLISIGRYEGHAKEAADMIAAWDGSTNRDDPEPLIFAAWARSLVRRLYADELGEAFDANWGFNEELTIRVLDNVEGEARWCDDRTTPDHEDCAQEVTLALEDALAELSEAYGDDITAWRWGDAHVAVHEAQPFGDFPIIGDWFNREIEVDGGAFTLQRAAYRFRSNRPYAAAHGAGYRGIYDLADIDNSRYVITTGQSGNLYSPHYDDLMPLWASGAYLRIPTDRARIDEETVAALTLNP